MDEATFIVQIGHGVQQLANIMAEFWESWSRFHDYHDHDDGRKEIKGFISSIFHTRIGNIMNRGCVMAIFYGGSDGAIIIFYHALALT